MVANGTGREREHGVIEGDSVRTVGMDAANARMVVREEEDLRYPLRASSLEPPVVRVAIADDALGLLTNGLGANWSPPGQGEDAFPADDDEDGWEQVFAGMDYAGVKWVRYWLQPMGVMTAGRPAPEHRLFARLDRLEAWAEKVGAGIMLELASVPPEHRFSDTYDAPADNRRYVEDYIVPLVCHVVNERQCRAIRQLCLFNEPFNADVTPPIFAPLPPKDALVHYLELHEILREALDREGLEDLRLIGPNSANLFQRHLEMYEDRGLAARVSAAFAELDCHIWRMRFDYYPPSKRWPGYPMSEGIERYLRPTLAAARRMGRQLSLTEAGSMYFNEAPCTERTTRHDAFLVMAEQLVRSVNEGIAGAMVWSFTSSGRIDGQWGWIGTRETGFAPVPNLLNGFAALMRFQRVGAEIHRCSTVPSDFSSFISAGALVAPGQGETVWLINDHPVERIRVRLRLPAKRKGTGFSLYRKDFSPELQRVGWIDDADAIDVVLPGMSFTTLTSLEPGTP